MDEHAHLQGGFGIANAANVVFVQRHEIRDVPTTAQRSFREIELPGKRYFRILPYEG